MWDMLIDRGYQADGLYIGLGIGEYSSDSGAYVARSFAGRVAYACARLDLRDDYGYDVPTASRGHRARAVLVVRAVEATPLRPGGRRRRLRRRGHRPQPRRRGGGAVRQHAAMGHRLPRPPAPASCRRPTASPRRSSRWSASPSARWQRGVSSEASTTWSRSARSPPATSTSSYKDSLNAIEVRSPGAKASFYLGFLDRMAPLLAAGARGGFGRAAGHDRHRAVRVPSTDDRRHRAFCRLVEQGGSVTTRSRGDGVGEGTAG